MFLYKTFQETNTDNKCRCTTAKSQSTVFQLCPTRSYSMFLKFNFPYFGKKTYLLVGYLRNLLPLITPTKNFQVDKKWTCFTFQLPKLGINISDD